MRSRRLDFEGRIAVDPAEAAARIELLALRARAEGPQVSWERLKERRRWQAADLSLRDAAIAEAARLLL